MTFVDVTWVVTQSDSVSYVSLTPKQYQNLSINMAEISRWVDQAAWLLRYYRR